MSRVLERLARPTLEAILSERAPEEVSRLLAPSRAAVAAILRFQASGPEVLLIERAHREGDRWSGQVSMPGGRADAADRDLLETALRETREEVGVDLEREGRLLGRLDDQRAIAKGRFLPMAISPFVFAAERPITPAPNEEAQAAFWLPLVPCARGELDGEHRYSLGPTHWTLPCWRHEGHVVWGLTYQMLRGLLRVAGAVER